MTTKIASPSSSSVSGGGSPGRSVPSQPRESGYRLLFNTRQSGRAKSEPVLLMETLEGVEGALMDGEELRCCSPFPPLFAVGTSAGRVLIFNAEGIHLLSTPILHDEGAGVLCVCLQQWCVLTAGEDGRIVFYDWIQDDVSTVGNRVDTHLTGLAATALYRPESGSVYYGTSIGTVVCRKQGMFGSYNDAVVFSDTWTAEAIFGAAWSSTQSRRGRMQSEIMRYASASSNSVEDDDDVFGDNDADLVDGFSALSVRDMLHVPPYVVFRWRKGVSVYNANTDSLVGCFSFETACDEHGKQQDGQQQGGEDDVQGLVAGRGEMHLLSETEWLLRWDQELFAVKLHTKKPLEVSSRYLVDAHMHILRTACVSKFVLLLYRDRMDGGIKLGLFLVQGLVPVDVVTLQEGGQSRNALGEEDWARCVQMMTMDRSTNRLLYQIASGSTLSFPMASTGALLLIMGTRTMHRVRKLEVSERVLWLTEHKEFSRALYLCQKSKRLREAMEVADAQAQHLWLQGNHSRAVGIWAEYILPSAPAQYWAAFAHRLEAAGYPELLEPFLPFNNRSLLGEEVYHRMLVRYLDNEDYEGFLERVSRWPVVYDVEAMIARIKQQLWDMQDSKEQALMMRMSGGSSGGASGLVNLLSPHRASYGTEALAGSFTVLSPSKAKRGRSGRTLEVARDESDEDRDEERDDEDAGDDEDSGEDHDDEAFRQQSIQTTTMTTTEAGEQRRMLERQRQSRFLYKALFKLYEFRNDFMEAVRVLVVLQSDNTMDYFVANKGWQVFRLGEFAETSSSSSSTSSQGGGSGLSITTTPTRVKKDLRVSGPSSPGGLRGRRMELSPESPRLSSSSATLGSASLVASSWGMPAPSPVTSLSAKRKQFVRYSQSNPEVERRRELLVDLLRMDGTRVVEALVDHLDDVPAHDVHTLLVHEPLLRLMYLEQLYSRVKPGRSASFHNDLIALCVLFVSENRAHLQGLEETVRRMGTRAEQDADLQFEITMLKREVDAKLTLLHKILRSSDWYDVDEAARACEEYELDTAMEIVVGRRESTQGKA